MGKSSWPWRPSHRIGINRATSTPIRSIIGPLSIHLERDSFSGCIGIGWTKQPCVGNHWVSGSRFVGGQEADGGKVAAARWAMLTASDPAEAQQNARAGASRGGDADAVQGLLRGLSDQVRRIGGLSSSGGAERRRAEANARVVRRSGGGERSGAEKRGGQRTLVVFGSVVSLVVATLLVWFHVVRNAFELQE